MTCYAELVRVALGVLLFVSGCAEISGLDGLGVCDGSCADVTVDDAPQAPEAGDDAAIDVATIDAPSDGGAPLDATAPCAKPADCPSIGAVCCEVLTTSGSQFPNCNVNTDKVGCMPATSCATMVGLTCGPFTFRRCTATADCTEPSAPKCCMLKISDAGTREICMSALNASVSGATCL